MTQSWPRNTLTRVKVVGNNEKQSTLTAKANIEWHPEPLSDYLITVETVYINLETGQEAYEPGVNANDDDDPADVYAAQVLAAKRETFQAFDIYVGTPLRVGEFAYVTAYEVMVPDKYDLIFAAGGAATKLFKAGRGAVKFVEFATKLSAKLTSNTSQILAKGRIALNVADNVPIIARTRSKLVRLRRGGKLPKDGERSDDVLGEVDLKTCWIGQFCFTKGTPVVMADGTLKPIEQVMIGDLVLSKDESTGEVAPKRVSHTTQRQAPSTLALTFSNGEVVETTDEHPVYVEHKGFTPAGLLVIGNSIVTRAGPSLGIASIEKRSTPAAVYNFTVEDFHTYFVGNAALWVHNIKCITEPRYRGGSKMRVRPARDVDLEEGTGLVLPTRGISLNSEPDKIKNFGGAYRVASIPDGLKIVHTGGSHYEIAPEVKMTLEQFQELLNQVVLVAE